MNKLKYIIVLLFILICITVILLIVLKNNASNENVTTLNIVEGQNIDYEKEEIKQLTDSIQFYNVTNCIYKYLSAINVNNPNLYGYSNGNYVKIAEGNQRIYNLLSTDYIKQNNITVSNVYDYVEKVEQNLYFTPLKMNVLIRPNVYKYAVYGLIEDIDCNSTQEMYYIVNLDIGNKTFSVEPLFNKKYTSLEQVKYTNQNTRIEKNSDNSYTDEKINYEYISKEYLNSFKRIMLGNPHVAFNMLDHDYRDKRFVTEDSFIKYIDENKDELKKVTLNQYLVKDEGSKRRYICIDQYNNYYIFYENNIMDYSVILDTYTIDIPEFTEKYTTAKEQEKVALNIQKIFQALNSKDYRYVYSKLADSFKNNYFKTQQDFENYIKNKVFEYNDVEYVQYNKSGNLNQYKLKLTDKTESNFDENGIEKTSKRYVDFSIVMQLGEGTEFTMSFEI